MDAIDKRLAARAKMTPATGFNVVGVDDYENDPSDELYLVGHFDDEAAAKAALAAKQREQPGGTFYLYAAE